MDTKYTVNTKENKVLAETTIPAKPERKVTTPYTIEQIQKNLDRALNVITDLNEQLITAQDEVAKWQTAKKAAIDGGVKTKEQIKEDAIKDVEVTPVKVIK